MQRLVITLIKNQAFLVAGLNKDFFSPNSSHKIELTKYVRNKTDLKGRSSTH